MSTLPSVESIVAKLDTWSKAYERESKIDTVEDVMIDLENMADDLAPTLEQARECLKTIHKLVKDIGDEGLALDLEDEVDYLDRYVGDFFSATGDLRDHARKLGTVR